MCGIFSFLKNKLSKEEYEQLYISFMNGSKRGPEYSSLAEVFKNVFFGFHRLAINGLNSESHQPLYHDGIYLICNGEIYNYKQQIKENNFKMNTDSDCEVIIHMYLKYGFEYTIQMLDGVFAINLLDVRNPDTPKLYVARDPFGVRPLFSFSNDDTFGFTSEVKMIRDYETSKQLSYNIEQFKPGHYQCIEYHEIKNTWIHNTPVKYYSTNVVQHINTEEPALEAIRTSLMAAVEKRVDNTDRPVACLLSGGLDSSLICALVNKLYAKNDRKLETFSIGLDGSVDLKYARLVAKHIGSKHNEIVVSEEEFLSALKHVIYTIESYDTTTVRASVGNYLVSRYIRENSDAKVIFNGDGSDEVCGGYMYFHCAPNSSFFDMECKRLLDDIAYFDVLRSDRSISSNGLEARTPFLDKNFVQTYFSIDKDVRCHGQHKQCEKYLLRKAFSKMNLLPDEVLWRTKEAFSDGVSSHKRSWYEIIQEHVGNITFDSSILKHFTHNVPITYEQKYYRKCFEEFYGAKHASIIPYFWMPKFVKNATDASARTLDIYKQTMDNTEREL